MLGTGGLVRAYSDATVEALDKADIKKKQKGVSIYFQTEYSNLEQLKYYLKQINGKLEKTEYANNVQVTIQVPSDKKEEFTKNYGKLPFKIENLEILTEKVVDI